MSVQKVKMRLDFVCSILLNDTYTSTMYRSRSWIQTCISHDSGVFLCSFMSGKRVSSLKARCIRFFLGKVYTMINASDTIWNFNDTRTRAIHVFTFRNFIGCLNIYCCWCSRKTKTINKELVHVCEMVINRLCVHEV